MKKVKITCDSTCDLTPALYEQYGIEVLPLGITLNDRGYKDGVDISRYPRGSFDALNAYIDEVVL